ncbi:MAG: hypothetical protein ACI9VN_003213 [Patescibacteria group bacterium]|jgi:hypothetical protein
MLKAICILIVGNGVSSLFYMWYFACESTESISLINYLLCNYIIVSCKVNLYVICRFLYYHCYGHINPKLAEVYSTSEGDF